MLSKSIFDFIKICKILDKRDLTKGKSLKNKVECHNYHE